MSEYNATHTCKVCKDQFEADQDWKVICPSCYKKGHRIRRDGRLYKIDTGDVQQIFGTTPTKPAKSRSSTDIDILNDLVEMRDKITSIILKLGGES
jgi:hypothetical protein